MLISGGTPEGCGAGRPKEDAMPREVAMLVPLVVIQLGLMALALHDLLQPERRVLGGSKLLWGLVIVLGELMGPVVYFAVGRREA